MVLAVTSTNEDTFPAVIATLAQRTPERIILREVGGRVANCAQFHTAVLEWAAAFQRLGVAPGTGVVVLLPNGIDSLACWLALGWIRAREVPVNLQFRGRMLAYVIDDADARVLVVDRRFLPQVLEVGPQLTRVSTLVVAGGEAPGPDCPFETLTTRDLFAGLEPARNLAVPVRTDLSTMIYTSGTTGPSKGVLIPWGIWSDSAPVIAARLGEGDVVYDPFPMFHTSGKALAQAGICAGAAVVLREVFSTNDFWDDIHRFGCTFAALVPAMTAWLLARPPDQRDRASPLRRVALSPIIPRVEEFKARFDVAIQTNFGMTEIGSPIGTATFTADITGNYGSCGRLSPGYDARIVDAQEREVAHGEVGELCLRAQLPGGLMDGYFGRPQATAEAWRNGWFHTGDAFRRDEGGNFYFVDRMKDALRRRGENISSFEVEAFVNAHPQVLASAAIGVPAEEGEEEIKIYVIAKPGSALNPAELLEALGPRMPRYMLPRYVEFVDDLPRTEATLRVQKAKLRERPLSGCTWDRELGRYLDDTG